MTGTTQQNGPNSRTVEETMLRLFQRRGYVITRPSGDQGGALAVLHARDHRALVRFQWGHQEEWDVDLVRAFRVQMEDLKASRGYLVTNGLFSSPVRDLAGDLSVSLTDGVALNDILFATMPPSQRAGRPEEPPLPFERYIPWFVGISLVMIVVVVLLLVSTALSLTPVSSPPSS